MVLEWKKFQTNAKHFTLPSFESDFYEGTASLVAMQMFFLNNGVCYNAPITY